MYREPSQPMRSDTGAVKGQEPGITGRITHHAAYLDINKRADLLGASKNEMRGENRWRAGEQRQIGADNAIRVSLCMCIV
ncbi:Hypothetical protein SMAX5B_004879 [Scophthalmus maximus]|uniref:Uncharacterized protein n=1 Tax=Scophthalmus maximus TaxID=52904 RepID=A0A2U9B988_SCOMX|nr:Hypothetical protein SMAX5B_004879 [Scophthalmus maximus]